MCLPKPMYHVLSFCISGDKSYKCTLDSASKKKAREELNEIESDRARAVQTLRSWVLEQRAWLKSPTGITRAVSMAVDLIDKRIQSY